eukprot:TRINITY_DN3647_c0_g1_i5.p1 TRINITY_DN3647_c0_g1~~TRINITY_DN3647_c0_g1_i5.p1  ORF type:complete len:368 (+),score=158.87 TRINITY_DN3647_c0_g1_i5:121-1224(+)
METVTAAITNMSIASTIPVEPNQDPIVPSKFSAEVASLKELGLSNEREMTRMLFRTNGNVEVIRNLLIARNKFREAKRAAHPIADPKLKRGPKKDHKEKKRDRKQGKCDRKDPAAKAELKDKIKAERKIALEEAITKATVIAASSDPNGVPLSEKNIAKLAKKMAKMEMKQKWKAEKQEMKDRKNEDKQSKKESRKAAKKVFDDADNAAPWSVSAPLYLDGNNMLFVLAPLRGMIVKGKGMRRAEKILIAMSRRFLELAPSLPLILTFDASPLEMEDGNLRVIKARPKYATSDDMLVEMATAEVASDVPSTFVTSDRGLIERLEALGKAIRRPKRFFVELQRLEGADGQPLDEWASAWINSHFQNAE